MVGPSRAVSPLSQLKRVSNTDWPALAATVTSLAQRNPLPKAWISAAPALLAALDDPTADLDLLVPALAWVPNSAVRSKLEALAIAAGPSICGKWQTDIAMSGNQTVTTGPLAMGGGFTAFNPVAIGKATILSVGADAVGADADLKNIDLSNIDLANIDLSGVDLAAADAPPADDDELRPTFRTTARAQPPQKSSAPKAVARKSSPRKSLARKSLARKSVAPKPTVRQSVEPPTASARKPVVPRKSVMRAEPPKSAPAAVPRRLQADVTLAGAKKPRVNTFVPGGEHQVSVVIAPGAVATLQLASALDETKVQFDADGSAALDVEFVFDGPGGTVSQRSSITLPATGESTRATFTLWVGSTATEVTCSILIFQKAALLQSAVISGPVAKIDKPVAGKRLRFVQDADLVSSPDPAAKGVDASISFHVGKPGDAVIASKTPGVGAGAADTVSINLVGVSAIAAFRDGLVGLLRQALDADDVDGTAPGSDQQVELMRNLARQGNSLFQQLDTSVKEMAGKRIIQVITAENDVVPLELIYDYGIPMTNAKLCATWQTALHDGRCTCKPKVGRIKTFCPLGFWGLRLIIERQLAAVAGKSGKADPVGQPRAGVDRLPSIDNVLFAASSEVDMVNQNERADTLQLLRDHLGSGVVEATSWSSWKASVASRGPGLLLTLPHTDDAAGLPTLKIGNRSSLEIAGITPKHVLAADATVGPIVFLLGCNTANADIPWQSSAAQFRRQGAAVVIGTLAETLGRQTGPMARLLADLLWGTDAVRAPTLGEIMLTVRRRLVDSGSTLGMSLVAFGHASWLLTRAES
jgi:hypothetical protein